MLGILAQGPSRSLNDILIAPDAVIQVVGLAILALAGLVSWFVLRPLLLAALRRITAKTKIAWDDALTGSPVVSRLSWLLTTLIVQAGAELAWLDLNERVRTIVQNIVLAVTIFVIAAILFALLDVGHVIYRRNAEHARRRPIKGYLQLGKIVIVLFAGVTAVAKLFGFEVGALLTGLGAATAVLLLIFKDTILSVIASINLTTNDMVRLGDWIEMPQVGADGDVIDIALHTVKVQNWDKTVTTIPTYKLYSESFKNWRGMQESGGRRIKRSIHVDQQSVRFLDDADLDRLGKIELLKDYLADKRRALAEANADAAGDPDVAPNRRRLTNLGTFRAYVAAYVKSRPTIHRDMTFLVRQLSPEDRGIAIEIYAFSNTIAWADYEQIQADLFDHLLAVVGEFDLRIYQQPSGADLRALRPTATTG